jgi:hypothetical protein
VADLLQSPEFNQELNERIESEQAQMKEYFGSQAVGLKELIGEFVKDTQVCNRFGHF